MTIENKQHRYVTYDEFNRFIIANDQKFENLTEIMLSQFDKVYAKFNEIDAKFDEIYTKFYEIDAKFDNVYSEFAKINDRIDKLESKMGTIESMLHLIINHLGIKTA